MRVGPSARAFAAGTAAGAIAGAVAGVGARVAMRAIALHAGGRSSGLYTSTGARVGDVTFSGTSYVIGTAAVLGAMAGLVYMVIRGALPRPRGLMFGVALLLVGMNVLIDHDRFDFRLFHPRALSLGLFAALFPLFGLCLSAIADRLAPPQRRAPRVASIAALIAVCALCLARDVRSANAIARHDTPFHVSLVAPTHSPSVTRPWHYVVHITDANGKPLPASVHMQVLFLGLPVGEIGTHEVSGGIWQETIRWPPASRGHALVLRALVTAEGKTESAIYGLKSR